MDVSENSEIIKEKEEIVGGTFDIVAQGVTSFADGAQLSDAPDFIDELMRLPKMINGLSENWAKESLAVANDPSLLDSLYSEQRVKLVLSGMDPILAATIETNAKGLHYALIAAKVSKIKKEA